MMEEQKMEIIESGAELQARCLALKHGNWRLVQMSCTALPDGDELNYTFDKDYEFLNLRIVAAPGNSLPSIQTIYLCAFIYENEISELFGVEFTDMEIDFNGQLYKTAMPAPFAKKPSGEEANN